MEINTALILYLFQNLKPFEVKIEQILKKVIEDINISYVLSHKELVIVLKKVITIKFFLFQIFI